MTAAWAAMAGLAAMAGASITRVAPNWRLTAARSATTRPETAAWVDMVERVERVDLAQAATQGAMGEMPVMAKKAVAVEVSIAPGQRR
jgi:hypothetical protein